MTLSADQIRFIQIETSTICNYRCPYCPVAHFRRAPRRMTLSTALRLVEQFRDFSNLETVFLNGYDEPTLNPDLPLIVSAVLDHPIGLTLFTNATHVTDPLITALAAGSERVLVDVHLSAIDPAGVAEMHGFRSADKALRGVRMLSEAARTSGFSLNVGLQVQSSDPRQQAWAEEAEQFLKSEGIASTRWSPNDRAGILTNRYGQGAYHRNLRGCGLEERTLSWLHVSAAGSAIICCQDYFEDYIVGDTADGRLVDIVQSPRRELYHQWATGSGEAPEDFICRRCSHAIGDL